MLYKRNRTQGIVLITVLLFSILIAMFIGAAIAVGPRSLGLASSQSGSFKATAAAQSGMQYALMRIRENPQWKGEGGGLVVSSADLTVVEDSGYVWGHMKAADGSTSMFRIRFNYEDGPGNGDGMDDSAGSRIDTAYVSVNNLSGSTAKVVPRADSGGQSKVQDSEKGPYTVPAHSLCLLVEGLSGPALSDFDPADPNPKGFAETQVLEGIFVASNLNDVAKNAVAMSNSDLKAQISEGESVKVEAKGGETPRIRSRGDVHVTEEGGTRGLYESEGAVHTRTATLDADYDLSKVTVESEDTTNPFYELSWDELKTADPTGPSLAAGTYVWWDDGSLHYYDLNYDEYAQWIKSSANVNNPGQVVFANGSYSGGFSPPSTMAITPQKMTITGDLYVAPTAAASDLTVIPREGAPEDTASLTTGSGPLVAGPALAAHLANDSNALRAFFSGRLGDGSQINLTGNQGWDTAGGSFADITWNNDGTGFWASPTDYPNGREEALADVFSKAGSSSNGYFVLPLSQLEEAVTKFGLDAPVGDLNLNTGDSLTPDELKIEFKPAKGESATLSAEGDVRIGANLKGEGASITSGGSLRVIGAGANLSATLNAEDGVNMYAKGDVILSTLKKKKNGDYEFKDIKLKGLVYTWGDFIAKLGSEDPNIDRGDFKLEGTLVAFGGDPAAGTPSSSGKGKIDIKAKKVELKFDPSYLLGVMKTLPSNIEFQRTTWTAY